MNNIDFWISQLDQRDTVSMTAARDKLISFGQAAVEPLLKVLQTGSPKQIASAVVVLAHLQEPRCVKYLLTLLEHPHLFIRMNAAQAAGNFPEPQVVDALTKRLSHDKDVVQMWLVDSLGRIGNPRAIQPLTTLLHSSIGSNLRYTVIRALLQLGDSKSLTDILRYQYDEDRHVQKAVQNAILKWGSLGAS